MHYDSAGNIIWTSGGNTTYTYDAENRIATVNGSGVAYSYDFEGHRAEKLACP